MLSPTRARFWIEKAEARLTAGDRQRRRGRPRAAATRFSTRRSYGFIMRV